ncbi:MFS transporter [Kribbella solani]|uniref:MFS transporter n=1 Tax=Kribbella solani TaxID=236067 RepID=UPI0029A2C756|nr:MFS transporter [Kribbella solani]MDX3006154.1 MFS transporter [Kribbella solani]
MGVPVRRLWVAVLAGYLAFGAALQVLPTDVPARFGGGALASGTAVGIAFLATACGRPFAGRLADAGRSRPVVLAGGVLAAIGGLGQLLAPDLVVLLLARLVMGAGEAALFSAALPWVLTGVRVAQRGRLAGWFGLSMWGGLAAGPVIATIVARLVDGGEDSRLGGEQVVWWVVVGLSVVSVLMVLTTRADPARREPLAPVRGIRDLVPRGVPLPGATIGLAAYCYGTVAALLVLRLRADHLAVDNIALAVFAAAFLVVRFAGSPLVDRYGGRRVAAASVSVEVLALTGIALADTTTAATAYTALAGAGLALIYPACVSMTLDRVRGLRPGVSMGVMTSFWDLGVMVAGPLGGLIAEGAGYPTAFLVAAGSGLACVLVCVIFLRTPRPATSPR